MDYKQARELLDWIEKSALTTASVSIGGSHVSASKQQMPDPYSYMPPPVMPAPLAAAQGAVQTITQSAAESPKFADPDETTKKDVPGHVVLSPMVATFYTSSGPDKPAFAPVGTAVKKGDVLCILEAMKVMNEFTSEFDGIVAQVYVENGEMVEARQPLFRIEN